MYCDDFDMNGYCECGSYIYISGDVRGCANSTCDYYASRQELADAA